jgi:hypothetical protein
LALAPVGPDDNHDLADLLTALDIAAGLDDVLEWGRAVQRYTFDGGQEGEAPTRRWWNVTSLLDQQRVLIRLAIDNLGPPTPGRRNATPQQRGSRGRDRERHTPNPPPVR